MRWCRMLEELQVEEVEVLEDVKDMMVDEVELEKLRQIKRWK